MPCATECIPKHLRTFFTPQMEQLGAVGRAARYGMVGSIDNERCRGTLWVAGVADSCLVTSHSMTPLQTFKLHETPAPSLCIASCSAAAALCCPTGRVPSPPRPLENIMVFAQGNEMSFAMDGAQTYASRSVSLLPGFFERCRDLGLPGWSVAQGSEEMLGAAQGGYGFADAATDASLRALLRAINPERAWDPVGETRVYARVVEAIALLMADIQEGRLAQSHAGSTGQQALATRAQHVVQAHLGEDLTLDRLARDLLVSRTRLCAAFKRETGMSVGAYVQTCRIDKAKQLLELDELDVREVARAVGYRQQGSFTERFRQQTGVTPTAWRAGARE